MFDKFYVVILLFLSSYYLLSNTLTQQVIIVLSCLAAPDPNLILDSALRWGRGARQVLSIFTQKLANKYKTMSMLGYVCGQC